MPELASRIKALAMLAVVAAAFAMGNYTPVLGFMDWPSNQNIQEQLLRFNILSAGFTAWTTAWALLQVYEMLKFWFFSKDQSFMPIANPLSLKVLVPALIISGLMWIGLLQGVGQIFFEETLTTPQMAMGVVTGLAGTGLLFFLARCLNQVLPAYGFWGLLALAGLYGFALSIPAGLDFLTLGAASPQRLIISGVLFILSIVAAVVLMTPKKTKSDLTPHHIFAVLVLTAAVSPWAADIVFYLFESMFPQLNEMLPEFAQGQAFQWLLIGASIILTLIFMVLISTQAYWNPRFWLSFLSIATIYVTNELIIQIGGLPWPQPPVLTLTFLAWCAHQLYAEIPAPPTAPEVDDVAFDDEFRRGWRN